MTTRALRGWILGNPFAQYEKEDKPWRRCDCDYHAPYLHSLIVRWLHWPKPIMRLPESEEEAAERIREQGLTPGFAGRAGREFVTGLYSGEGPSIITHEEGMWMWQMTSSPRSRRNGAGYYSYNPAHIERMGNWDQVGVIGVVTLFGEIAVHERGYRSEGVRIDRLWVLQEASVFRPSDRIQTHLEKTYRCEVTMLRKKLYDGFRDWLVREDVENLL